MLSLPLLLALACTTSSDAPTSWEDCGDPDCRIAWAVATWDSDQQAVIDAVVSVQDEVEQVALVVALAEGKIGQTQELCSALERGPARVKCNQLNSRLHLVQDQPMLPAGLDREAPGPVSWRLDINDLPASPLADVQLEQDPCAGTDSERECRIRNAKVEAGGGDVRRAAGFCHAVDDETWQAECYFQSAEKRIIESRGLPQAGVDAVDLCLLAGRFADNCLGHIPLRIAEGVPPVDGAPPETWARLLEQADTLHQALVDRGAPDLAEGVDGLFWAETMGYTYTTSRAIVGDPLDLLPERAHPHIRTAAAVAMARNPAPQREPTLASLSTELSTALARRGKQAERQGATQGPWRPRADLWPRDEPGDGGIPAVVYLGVSRRAWVMDDPAADLRVAILEAQARLSDDPSGVLADGLEDENPLVQWSAKRLIRMRSELPQGPAAPGAPGSAPGGDGPPKPPSHFGPGRGGQRGKAPPPPGGRGGPGAPRGRGGPPPGTRASGPPPGQGQQQPLPTPDD